MLEEGVALRAADIDVIYLTGYGFPGFRGGPMFHADTVGLDKVLSRVSEFHRQLGDRWKPAPLLERLVEEWGPDSPDDSLPKQLARELQGKLPVIHGSGPTVAVARRWHTQLNENAESAAFWSELPEANHNEICGWERGTKTAPLGVASAARKRRPGERCAVAIIGRLPSGRGTSVAAAGCCARRRGRPRAR